MLQYTFIAAVCSVHDIHGHPNKNILNSSSAAVMVNKFTAEFGIYIYIYIRGLHNCGLEDSRLAAKF